MDIATESQSRPDPGWPPEVVPLLQRALVCHYASLTRDGRPITWPVAPYLGDDGTTVDVSTGLSYPTKAERARRDSRVALLFTDPVGSGLSDPPIVLVQGLASVRDADLQANLSGSVTLTPAGDPIAFYSTPCQVYINSAVPTNRSDPLLVNWTKQGPMLSANESVTGGSGLAADGHDWGMTFRDPTTAWPAPSQTMAEIEKIYPGTNKEDNTI